MIDVTTSRETFTGPGTSFTFHFKVWSADELAVYVNDGTTETKVTDWTLSSLSDTEGTIAYDLPSGSTLAIIRSMPFLQNTSLTNHTRFDPAVIENQFDIDCIERQQLKEELSRCVKVGATKTYNETVVLAEELLAAEQTAISAAAEARATVATGVAEITALADEQATRLKDITAFDELAKGLSCSEHTLTITSAIASGDEYALPDGVYYAVGHHHLRLAIEGVTLDQRFWSEVGDTDTVSSTVTFLMPINAGRTLNIWVTPLKYD